MTYSLRRTRDGAGDSGQMSEALMTEDGQFVFGENGYPKDIGPRPQVGCCMKVGSHYARTYHHQDWWLTTPITEILEERENYVRFKTGNSEYVWEIL